MQSFIHELSESKVFPTIKSLKQYSIQDIADLTLLYILALRILYEEDDTREFARSYAYKTIQWGKFDHWRSSATDLYVLLHILKHNAADDDREHSYPFNIAQAQRWLREMSIDHTNEVLTKRVFLRLDFDLRIKDSTMKSVRRLVMDWSDLDKHKKRLAMTKLLQFIRSRAPRSELLSHLKDLARDDDLEIEGACNTEIEPKAFTKDTSFLSFLKRDKD